MNRPPPCPPRRHPRGCPKARSYSKGIEKARFNRDPAYRKTILTDLRTAIEELQYAYMQTMRS